MKTTKNLTGLTIRDRLYPKFITEKQRVFNIINNSTTPGDYWIEYLKELEYDLLEVRKYLRDKNNMPKL